jgi:hypothetical protein
MNESVGVPELTFAGLAGPSARAKDRERHQHGRNDGSREKERRRDDHADSPSEERPDGAADGIGELLVDCELALPKPLDANIG